MAPLTLLAAGTTIASLLTSDRFTEAPEGPLKSLAQDLEMEDKVLEDVLENGRLELWWDGIIDDVKASIREDADREGIEAAQRAESKRNLIEAMGLVDSNGEDGLVTGLVDGIQRDGEGDVLMYT